MNICDPKVFKQVYFEWIKPVQRFIQSKGLGISQSADLSQEAFIRLWNNCAKVTREKSKPFLFTVANNLVIDDFRKNQTQLKLKQRPVQNTSSVDPQYQLEMEEFKKKLEQAIDSMTPGAREVFILYRFNDMSYKEIAAQLSLSVKAVEKRMSKGLRHLAAVMGRRV